MKSIVSIRRHGKPHGFTLIEMLVVVSIIVLLMTLAAPSFMGTIQANRLSAAGQNLVGRLSQAQQTASSINLPVEVRFYRYTDKSQVSAQNYFSAYQFILVKTTTTTGAASETLEALSSPFFLESGVYITAGTINGLPASPLLTGTGANTYKDDGSTTGDSGLNTKQITKGSDATFIAIRLYPNGSVKRLSSSSLAADGAGANDKLRLMQSLNLADAYLTLVGEKDVNGGNNVLNYYAVQIDPYTGHVRSYQPGLPTTAH